MGFVQFIHAGVCIALVVVILMQSGRGGGLTEGFASAESMFGAKTNVFMIKTTTVIATLFLVTCLSLALLSSKKEQSLMGNKIAIPQGVVQPEEAPAEATEIPAAAGSTVPAENSAEAETPEDNTK